MTVNDKEICPSCRMPTIFRDNDYWFCETCGDSNIEYVEDWGRYEYQAQEYEDEDEDEE